LEKRPPNYNFAHNAVANRFLELYQEGENTEINNVSCPSCSSDDDIYIFKVRDYTTELVGRRNEKEGFYYVQRGDGFIFKYEDYRITFSKKIV